MPVAAVAVWVVAVLAVVGQAEWVVECLRLCGAVGALEWVALVRLRSVGRIVSRR